MRRPGVRLRGWMGVGFTAALTLFTAFVLLDTFVIPHPYAVVPAEIPVTAGSTGADPVVEDPPLAGPVGTAPASPDVLTPAASMCGLAPQTDTVTYADPVRAIAVSSYRVTGTDVYVADIVVSDPAVIKTAFADNTYGRNVTAVTSSIAAANEAVLAVNGDFYGARTSGYVVRDKQVYRAKAAAADQEDLAVLEDGTWRIIREGDVTAADLVAQGVVDVFNFGPGLVEDGHTSVGTGTEVDRAKASNPRTAIAQVGALHYLFVVADGRTSQSAGLSLTQLGDFLAGCGAQTAYNLDGGGSSTMWFQGQVVNVPTDGKSQSERKVSDIVYV